MLVFHFIIIFIFGSSPFFVSVYLLSAILARERRGRDRMVVGFTTIYAIGAYHH
jgi:hypothetical protein